MLQTFLFHLAIQGAATEFCRAGQMHRIRDARAVGCHSFVRRFYIFRATLARFQRESRKLSVHSVVLCASCPPLYCLGDTLGGRGVRYARTIIIKSFKNKASGERGPRRTLRSHDCQRASRKLRVHEAVLCSPCAHHAPHYTAQALRAEAAAYATLA